MTDGDDASFRSSAGATWRPTPARPDDVPRAIAAEYNHVAAASTSSAGRLGRCALREMAAFATLGRSFQLSFPFGGVVESAGFIDRIPHRRHAPLSRPALEILGLFEQLQLLLVQQVIFRKHEVYQLLRVN